MSRLTGFADLAGKRVGLFGYGVEGRATERRLRGIADLVLVDDRDDLGPEVLSTDGGGLDALALCEVVLKSPGIPRRRPDVLELEQHGVIVTSALNLWLHDIERERVVAVTGTKGKSTTTALVTFFLRSLGERAQSLGNMGQPPYDPSVDTSAGYLILEVSSFQCVDLELAPALIVVTSLGADHLDWHGSLERYREDKLSITRALGTHRTLVPDDGVFHDIHAQLGGEITYVAPDRRQLREKLGLLGAHNDTNIALALAATHYLTGRNDEDLRGAINAASPPFEPLRGRLTLVATETISGATRRYVDDGLATSALPTLAALEVFDSENLALIAGGFDRGIDYDALASRLADRVRPTTLITLGPAGQRLGRALAQRSTFPQHHVATMREAVDLARSATTEGGIVLLSPAAPSFDLYQNWQERSDDFTTIVHSLVG